MKGRDGIRKKKKNMFSPEFPKSCVFKSPKRIYIYQEREKEKEKKRKNLNPKNTIKIPRGGIVREI